MRGLGIGDEFETVVFVGYDVAAKPDPEPFYTALDALDVEVEHTVKIGKLLESDVTGAHNAGLRSVWLDRDGVTVSMFGPGEMLQAAIGSAGPSVGHRRGSLRSLFG